MHRGSSFDQPDGQFLAHANTVNDQCKEHAVEWKLDSERLASLNLLITNANAAYADNSDTATRNLITSTNKKTAFGELKHFLSLFVDYLEGTLSVPDEALAVMGLRPRTHHASQPQSTADDAPMLKVVKKHDEMTVYVAQTELGHPTQSTKKKKYFGFKLRWRFEGETFYRTEVSTRLHFTLHFDREDETKRVIIAAAWINSRLEEGPWSEDVTEVVG
ncbi:MAG: hypothetical protein LBG45_12870 [Dysgonamonadaceae bacterium]|jgi:hypothetical protein|nr:hypothetical protein [Dysgonamonadaceae bacterium]